MFFTSDQHFGHENIIKFCNRPFTGVEDQTNQLIANHNAKVSKGDRVYHLGDIFWRTLTVKQALDILDALNGQHYFIWGNHDEVLEQNGIVHNRFIWCRDIAVLPKTTIHPRLILCHYAMYVWPGSHRGDWQLYGHTHNQLPDYGRLSIDVGVDANNYAPISIDEVIVKMTDKIKQGNCDPLTKKIQKDNWGVK